MEGGEEDVPEELYEVYLRVECRLEGGGPGACLGGPFCAIECVCTKSPAPSVEVEVGEVDAERSTRCDVDSGLWA
jgi:hypothetical protein